MIHDTNPNDVGKRFPRFIFFQNGGHLYLLMCAGNPWNYLRINKLRFQLLFSN